MIDVASPENPLGSIAMGCIGMGMGAFWFWITRRKESRENSAVGTVMRPIGVVMFAAGLYLVVESAWFLVTHRALP